MQRTLAWVGDGAPRMEVARVDVRRREIVADGTQLGAVYELRYRLDGASLSLMLVGDRSVDVELGDADFFDLGWSPLFNSLPVIAHDLHRGGEPRDFVMQWVDVPSLAIRRSEQRYEPLAAGVVRYSSGSFATEIRFDDDGFVTEYVGLARRVG